MFKKLSMVLLTLSLFACSGSNDTDKPTATAPTTPAPTSASTTNTTATGQYVEGTHYTTLKEPIAASNDNIVVTEFFWYGCPHCEHFEPLLEAWNQKKPAGVVLVKSPAIWSEPMKLHAKLFYLIQTLPNRDFVHSALFAEVIGLRDEVDLEKQSQQIAQFLAKFGVNEADYTTKMASPQLEEKMQAALKLMQTAEISGTPTIMVNGKYIVNNQAVGSVEEILAVADYLIAKEKQLR